MIKKITAMIIVAVMTFTTNVFATYNYARFYPDVAGVNISGWGTPSGNKFFTSISNEKYIVLDCAKEKESELYIDVSDSFLYGQSCDVSVEVTYYDEGTSEFSINYENYNPDTLSYELKKESIALGNTNKKKTTEFTIEGVAFENRFTYADGTDFYIKAEADDEGNSGELQIRTIKITPFGMVDMLKVDLTTDNYGNIFSGRKQILYADVFNMSETENYDGIFKYTAVYEDETVAAQGEEPITITSDAKLRIPIELRLKKYGIYRLDVELVSDKGVCRKTLPFSVINASYGDELNDKFYAQTHMDRYRNGAITALRMAGFGGTRDGIAWSVTEKTGNIEKYIPPLHADYVTSDVKKAGMTPLLNLGYGNVLYDQENYSANNDGKKSELVAPYTDTGIKAYAEYCGYIAKQYGEYVDYYEIWNEYNLKGFNLEERGADVYAKMLKAASDAVKTADPGAKIVAMATSQADATFIVSVINELKKIDAEDCFDIVSVHPYQWTGTYSEQTFRNDLNKIKLVTDKPVWCTELGWSTTEYNSGRNYGVTSTEQAIFGIKEYVISQAENLCERIYWYDFQDDGTDDSNVENGFGLIESTKDEYPNTAKPSYIAFAAMNKLLGNKNFEKSMSGSGWKAYQFSDENGKKVIVFWGDEGTEVDIDFENAQIMDMYSNVIGTDVDGVCTFTLGDTITYVGDQVYDTECRVSYKNGVIDVTGTSQTPGEKVTIYIYSDNDQYIYADQTTSNEFAEYTFTADTLGEGVVYIRVNYGEIYNGTAVPNILIKLMCGDKDIVSVDEISGENIELVVKVNEAFEKDVDIFGAVYDKNMLQNVNKNTITAGSIGEFKIPLKLETGIDLKRISAFIWNRDMSPIYKKHFDMVEGGE